MAQTPYGVPYPTPTDPVSAGANDIRAVAEALDARVLAGSLDWGDPGAAADTRLYRASAGILKTDGALYTVGELASYADSPNRITLASDCGIYFSNLADTVLYRSGPQWLVTNSTFTASGDLTTNASLKLDQGNVGSGLYFGSAADTFLYRMAAGKLKTGGRFDAAGDIYAQADAATYVGLGLIGPGGEAALALSADTTLYRAAAATLQTDAQLKINNALHVLADSPGWADGESGLNIKFHNYSEIRKVVAGAPDSGGPGYRALVITN